MEGCLLAVGEAGGYGGISAACGGDVHWLWGSVRMLGFRDPAEYGGASGCGGACGLRDHFNISQCFLSQAGYGALQGV